MSASVSLTTASWKHQDIPSGAVQMSDSQMQSGHNPVSNVEAHPDFPEVVTPECEQPQEGQPGDSNPTTEDGKEEVEMPEGFSGESSFEISAPDTSGLPDIGEASYGPLPPVSESVIGRDDRVRINNTGIYPWRTYASLLITARDGTRYIGTGWFVGPHTLITAGHVVYIKNSGVPGRDGWVRSISVMPGRNGRKLPYGSVTSTSFRSVHGWTKNGDQNYDYGAIILPTNLGNKTGWLGFGAFSNQTILSSIGNIAGYPGDKPSGTMWYDSRKIVSVNGRKVYYQIDTAGGQSGSPVVRIQNGKRYAFAIHAYGGRTANSGTRINKPVFSNIKNWKK